MCYNAVDRHVKHGIGDQVALVYDSPLTDSVKRITYSELQNQVREDFSFNSIWLTLDRNIIWWLSENEIGRHRTVALNYLAVHLCRC